MAVDSDKCQPVVQQMPGDKEGLMAVDLSNLEAETRCPVCLGVIKNARLVSGCMHRFCAECIEKWLRVCRENNCPQCRMPMQSRRDCKKDGKYDRLLRLLYDDIEKYETEMLEADDAILEQAMQTGAALKRARDNQKAARKQRAEQAQTMGYQGQPGLQGLEYKGPYRAVPVGPCQWVHPVTFANSPEEYFIAFGLQQPATPAHETTEMIEDAAVQATASEAAAAAADLTNAADPRSDTAGTATAPGKDQQGQSQQLQAQRVLAVQQTCGDQVAAVKAEASNQAMSDGSVGPSQSGAGYLLKAPGQKQPSKFPLNSPGKVVPLSSVQPVGKQQSSSAQRSIPVGLPSVSMGLTTGIVGSTTGIVGRAWPGQPLYSQPAGSAGSGPNEGKGTKRASGAEGKGRKKQRQGDRERSTDADGGRQSTGPIAAFLRPLPPVQPEAEAKAMAASLAASAAAHAKQQDHAVRAVVQIHLTPESAAEAAHALPVLPRPYLSCPADMQIQQLQQVVAQELKHAKRPKIDGVDVALSVKADGQTNLLQPELTLGKLSERQQNLQQHLELQFGMRP